MTGLPSYSTTASENVSANTGINWDEGMPPATVNNSARQNMADERAQWNDASWFQYGIGSKTVAAVYASGTSFTLAGADATAYWHAGRRVRAIGSSTGTIYGTVSNSAFAASTTTVTVVWDSGALSNETLAIYASTTPVTGYPTPFQKANRYYDGAVGNPNPTGSTSYVMMGLGASWTLTPRTSGRVRFLVSGLITNDTANADTFILGKYGTSTAPINGASVTGTSATTNEKRITTKGVGLNLDDFVYYAEISGLTLGTAYWFDIAVKVTGGNALPKALVVSIEEIPA